MQCFNCKSEINEEDNFCYKCGEWTSKGYKFLKDKNNYKKLANGAAYKQKDRLGILISLLGIGFVLFIIMFLISGNDMFKPVAYLKKHLYSYIYGYNISLMDTSRIYNNQNINSIESAKDIINKDFDTQNWECNTSIDVSRIETYIENTYNITNVNLCDMSYNEALKIQNVIDKMNKIFPNIYNLLTNITITNGNKDDKFVAYFEPIYEFVNSNEDINKYNKVNKTQILLNSYYFLNQDFLNNSINSLSGDGWYVKGATWDSTIAHELGHYISFYLLLKEYNINDVILVTKDNEEKINELIKIINNGEFSKKIVNEAINNYNINNNLELTDEEFTLKISKYANIKDSNSNLIYDETIAEAIHDYYLNGNNASSCSLEIVKIIKNRLGEV